MATAPILAMPDFAHPFTVETNANGWGMGVILRQKGYPIAYISKAFGPSSRDSLYMKKNSWQLLLLFLNGGTT